MNSWLETAGLIFVLWFGLACVVVGIFSIWQQRTKR